VRNALGSWKRMFDGEGREICWNHVTELYNIQKTNGFSLANKLTKHHVNYEKNKMKVKYAAQTFSQSVANALLTMNQLQHKSFEDVTGTVNYLKTFDTIFDIMNSRTISEHFSKAPLKKDNEHTWKSVFEKTAHYICHLKSNNKELTVLKSTKYASFLGIDLLYFYFLFHLLTIHEVQNHLKLFSSFFKILCFQIKQTILYSISISYFAGWLVNIKTISILYDYIIQNNYLMYICTYKLCQDPLETFFSSIRMSVGCGNNPTPVQFKAAFQSLLCNTLN
jgi:hypothetical protein